MGNYDADEDERTGYDHTSPRPQEDFIQKLINPPPKEDFLDAISQIESSGGKNLNHPDRVLEKFEDPNMAAYAWHSGHNLTPEQIKARDYLNDPYVQKFQKIWKSLGNK